MWGAIVARSHDFRGNPASSKEEKRGCEELYSGKPRRWSYVALQLTTLIPITKIDERVLTFVRHFPESINTRGGYVPGERPHPHARPEQRLDGETESYSAFCCSTHGADSLAPVDKN